MKITHSITTLLFTYTATTVLSGCSILLVDARVRGGAGEGRGQQHRELNYKPYGDPCSSSLGEEGRPGNCASFICNDHVGRCDAYEQIEETELNVATYKGAAGALCVYDSDCLSQDCSYENGNACADYQTGNPAYSAYDCGICVSDTDSGLGIGEDCNEDADCTSGLECVTYYQEIVLGTGIKNWKLCQDPTGKAIGESCSTDDECATGLCSPQTMMEVETYLEFGLEVASQDIYVCAACDGEISGLIYVSDPVDMPDYLETVTEDGCWDGRLDGDGSIEPIFMFDTSADVSQYETGEGTSGAYPLKDEFNNNNGIGLFYKLYRWDDFVDASLNTRSGWRFMQEHYAHSLNSNLTPNSFWFRNLPPGTYRVSLDDKSATDELQINEHCSRNVFSCDGAIKKEEDVVYHYTRDIVIGQCRGARVKRADSAYMWRRNVPVGDETFKLDERSCD